MPERELKKKPAPQRREDEVVEEPVATDSGEKIYKGRIGFVSPRAEFTPKSVETTDLRTDLVYRLRIVVANADDGPPRGRELELAGLLRTLQQRRVRNVVWVTADVHYCAAHHYDPARAHGAAFDPFWEFVAGPAHAGTFAPVPLDGTFGPQVRFSGVPADLPPNRPPSAGLQFFGTLDAEPRSRVLTASLWNLAGQRVFSVDLEPEG